MIEFLLNPGAVLPKKKKQKNLRDLSVLSTLHLHFSLSLCESTKNAPKNGKMLCLSSEKKGKTNPPQKQV